GPGSTARVHFQITNDSYEGATLAKVEVALLGVVSLFEDRIAEPLPPQLVKEVGSPGEIPFAHPRPLANQSPPRTPFKAPPHPPSSRRLETASAQPAVARPTLASRDRPQLFLPGKTTGKGGTAQVTLRARNAFDLSAEAKLSVTSMARPPRVTQYPKDLP